MEWTENELESLKIDFSSLSKNDLEIKYGRKFDTIRKIANKMDLHRICPKRIFISDEKLLEISKDTTKSILDYCRELGISNPSLMERLKGKSLSKVIKRKHQVDETYFNELNDEHKNYWFGFILADGHIREEDNMLQIELNIKDIELLNKFKEDIKFEGDIKINNERQSAKIRIFSEKIFNDLIIHGCIQQKSKHLKYPSNISDQYIHHFLRGYFDGDGSIRCSKTALSSASFSIYSTKDFCIGYQKIIINKLKFSKTKIRKSVGCNHLDYAGRKQIKSLYNFLYKDSTIYLNRKRDRFDAIININNIEERNKIIFN